MRHLLEAFHEDPRQVLDGVRGKLLDAIVQDPGLSFTELVKQAAGARSFGTVLHHLYVLERLGLVRSVKAARNRRFFPVDAPDMESAALARTEPYRGFLEYVRRNPGLGVSAMARKTPNRTRQALYVRLRRLSTAGLVEPRPGVSPMGRRVVGYWAVQG